MMTRHEALSLLYKLQYQGLHLRTEAGKLMVGPSERLTPALKMIITDNRDGLTYWVETDEKVDRWIDEHLAMERRGKR